jgi:hypothetical protein
LLIYVHMVILNLSSLENIYLRASWISTLAWLCWTPYYKILLFIIRICYIHTRKIVRAWIQYVSLAILLPILSFRNFLRLYFANNIFRSLAINWRQKVMMFICNTSIVLYRKWHPPWKKICRDQHVRCGASLLWKQP